jgi:predicted homoserine dehydrogenase-like protein
VVGSPGGLERDEQFMKSLTERLEALERPITIGIVGIGSIGKGMVPQAQITPGMKCVAVCDIRLERAVRWVEQNGYDSRVVETLDELDDAVRSGKMAVCEDGDLIARSEAIQVFIEATNSVIAGAQSALTAIEHEKAILMMNYEADLMYGPYLMRRAEEKGLVYTVMDGDQPTVLAHLIEELRFMGFELVMAGNMKGYLDRYTNPTLIIPEADKRDLDYKMCSSYTDGSKLCVEMAVLANGLDLRTATPGMHGPRMDSIHDVFAHFDFGALWDGRTGLVDYVLGAKPIGGVFAIGFTDRPYQQRTLEWFPPNMGPGPFYLFYRPYHLGHFETMNTVASAVLDHRPVLKRAFGYQTNVFSYAKIDLKKGDQLDGAGGYAAYGLIENLNDAHVAQGVPICIAEKMTLKRDIAKDERIRWEDVEYDPAEPAIALYLSAMEEDRSRG